MITFTKLGNYGRMGNQMSQVAAVIGIAKAMGVDYCLPVWGYARYFRIGKKFPLGKGFTPTVEVRERLYEYDPEFNDINAFALKNKPTDILGYFQSEKWFIGALNEIQEALLFNDDMLWTFLNNCEYTPQDEDVAVHVRRGDYVDNPGYVKLSPEYYGSIFAANLDKTYHIFTDDYSYARFHFRHYPNVLFCDGYTEIEHLMLMSQFTEHVIANSSFSWWGAWLAEQYHKNVRVIRPDGLFSGELATINNDKDFYPERWEKRDIHATIDLTDTTFIIPVSHDSKDRRKNLELIVCMLQRNFTTNIIIGEQGTKDFSVFKEWCAYVYFDMPDFHRTKMLNEMTRMAKTPYVVNYDADVLMTPGQLWKSIHLLRTGEADFTYPYDSRFARVPRIPWFKKVSHNLDLAVLKDELFSGMEPGAYISVGGAVSYSKDKFFECGMENEHFVSHAPEDAERFYRYNMLGYKVKRTAGALYHIDHWMGPNSRHQHKFEQQNRTEWRQVKHMLKDELREYVETWAWPKQIEPSVVCE